ncbi:MAG: hypothetical protein ACI38B_02330 [Bifidobacterium sp.]|uniref:hypothetical protein n=1 Tax=Bifidobacterium sp. TaxID=41200 RepID=UPI003F0C0BD8
MRLTHFVRRHIEENQRIRDYPVRASLSAFTPVTAASLCSSIPARHIPARRHPYAASLHLAYAAYAAYARRLHDIRGERLTRLERLKRVGNVRKPGAASGHISAKRGTTRATPGITP